MAMRRNERTSLVWVSGILIPRYVLLAEFSDYSSGLVFCWFAEDLVYLEWQIVDNIGTVD